MGTTAHENTLAPLVEAYIVGRVRRGEILAETGRSFRYRLGGLSTSYGRRPLDKFGPAAIDRWLESIGHHAPSTRREYLSVVRGFCRWLVARGTIRTDPTTHVPAIHQPRRAPQTLTATEVARLLAHVQDDLRAVAMVWLMVGCGCRCVEVSRLRVEDFDPVARTIRLVGKGGHERVIPTPDPVADAIGAYLDDVGWTGGPLLRSRRDEGQGLSAHSVGRYTRDWLASSGIKQRALDGRSAHGLRRTAGSDVMDRSGDIRIVQEMLGHARMETTARYYLRPVTIGQMREAMEGRTYAGGGDHDHDTRDARPARPVERRVA